MSLRWNRVSADRHRRIGASRSTASGQREPLLGRAGPPLAVDHQLDRRAVDASGRRTSARRRRARRAGPRGNRAGAAPCPARSSRRRVRRRSRRPHASRHRARAARRHSLRRGPAADRRIATIGPAVLCADRRRARAGAIRRQSPSRMPSRTSLQVAPGPARILDQRGALAGADAGAAQGGSRRQARDDRVGLALRRGAPAQQVGRAAGQHQDIAAPAFEPGDHRVGGAVAGEHREAADRAARRVAGTGRPPLGNVDHPLGRCAGMRRRPRSRRESRRRRCCRSRR